MTIAPRSGQPAQKRYAWESLGLVMVAINSVLPRSWRLTQ